MRVGMLMFLVACGETGPAEPEVPPPPSEVVVDPAASSLRSGEDLVVLTSHLMDASPDSWDDDLVVHADGSYQRFDKAGVLTAEDLEWVKTSLSTGSFRAEHRTDEVQCAQVPDTEWKLSSPARGGEIATWVTPCGPPPPKLVEDMVQRLTASIDPG